MSKREREEEEYFLTEKRIKENEDEIVLLKRELLDKIHLICDRKKEIESLHVVKQDLKTTLDSYDIWKRVDPTNALNIDILFLIVSSFACYKDIIRMAGVSKKWRYMIFSFLPKLVNYEDLCYVFRFKTQKSFSRFRGSFRNKHWRYFMKDIELPYWKSCEVTAPKNHYEMIVHATFPDKFIFTLMQVNVNGCKRLSVSNLNHTPHLMGNTQHLTHLVLSNIRSLFNMRCFFGMTSEYFPSITHIAFHRMTFDVVFIQPTIKVAIFSHCNFVKDYDTVCMETTPDTCYFYSCCFGKSRASYSDNLSKLQNLHTEFGPNMFYDIRIPYNVYMRIAMETYKANFNEIEV